MGVETFLKAWCPPVLSRWKLLLLPALLPPAGWLSSWSVTPLHLRYRLNHVFGMCEDAAGHREESSNRSAGVPLTKIRRPGQGIKPCTLLPQIENSRFRGILGAKTITRHLAVIDWDRQYICYVFYFGRDNLLALDWLNTQLLKVFTQNLHLNVSTGVSLTCFTLNSAWWIFMCIFRTDFLFVAKMHSEQEYWTCWGLSLHVSLCFASLALVRKLFPTPLAATLFMSYHMIKESFVSHYFFFCKVCKFSFGRYDKS